MIAVTQDNKGLRKAKKVWNPREGNMNGLMLISISPPFGDTSILGLLLPSGWGLALSPGLRNRIVFKVAVLVAVSPLQQPQ